MNLYRHRQSNKLYTIEHLVLDIHHLNANGFAGIYAYPYKWVGETIVHNYETQIVKGEPFNPEGFVEENFEVIAELRSL